MALCESVAKHRLLAHAAPCQGEDPTWETYPLLHIEGTLKIAWNWKIYYFRLKFMVWYGFYYGMINGKKLKYLFPRIQVLNIVKVNQKYQHLPWYRVQIFKIISYFSVIIFILWYILFNIFKIFLDIIYGSYNKVYSYFYLC